MKEQLKFLFFWVLTLQVLTNCSHYVHGLHREFDRQLSKSGPKRRKKDVFALYKKKKYLSPSISTQNRHYMPPTVKRHYIPVEKKRYKADDLNDNQNDGSLWNGERGKNQFFFALNNEKSHGDIVLIQVYSNLKEDISRELKRIFPTKSLGQIKDNFSNPNLKKEEKETLVPEAFDQISSVVVEEINNNHLLLRGRKNLLYQGRKRLVEIQAMVLKKDISDDDTISSKRIIESSITVIR